MQDPLAERYDIIHISMSILRKHPYQLFIRTCGAPGSRSRAEKETGSPTRGLANTGDRDIPKRGVPKGELHIAGGSRNVRNGICQYEVDGMSITPKKTGAKARRVVFTKPMEAPKTSSGAK